GRDEDQDGQPDEQEAHRDRGPEFGRAVEAHLRGGDGLGGVPDVCASVAGAVRAPALDLPLESLENRFVLGAFPAKAAELRGLLGCLRFLPGRPRCGGGAPVHALQADAEFLKGRGLFGDQAVELALAGLEARALAVEDGDFAWRWWDLVEPGEPDGVEPGGTRRAVPFVHRPCGRVLAGDRGLRVEAPESAVLARARCRLVDQVRRPLVGLPRPDRQSVAASEVDEGDAERTSLLVALAEPRPPEAAKRLSELLDPPWRRDRHFCLVLACPEV